MSLATHHLRRGASWSQTKREMSQVKPVALVTFEENSTNPHSAVEESETGSSYVVQAGYKQAM